MILDDIWWCLMIFDDVLYTFSDPPPPCIKSSLPKQVMQCLQSDNVFAQRSQIKQINFFWFDHFFTYWILFEPSCCPERTVLGSDGSSVVYQLASGFLLFMIFIIIFGENHICQHIGYCLYFDSHMFQLSYEQYAKWWMIFSQIPTTVVEMGVCTHNRTQWILQFASSIELLAHF